MTVARSLQLVLLGVVAWLLLPDGAAWGQKSPFNQYVDLNNCAMSRASWMAVARQSPGFGWQLSPEGRDTQVFAEAMARLDVIRMSDRFRLHCCKVQVWQDPRTQAMVAVPENATPKPGLMPLSSPELCCEDAALFMGADPMGCTVLPLASVPGASVVVTQIGFASTTGVPVTIPDSPPVTVAALATPPGAGIYLGCFRDPNNPFNLDGYLERSGQNTPERCIALCRDRGFAYAGVEYGESCLCGNSYDAFGPADNCDMPCTGDPGQICGGINANSVYATGP